MVEKEDAIALGERALSRAPDGGGVVFDSARFLAVRFEKFEAA